MGEADVLTGQLACPRSPPDALASFVDETIPKESWIVEGLCAYVPQVGLNAFQVSDLHNSVDNKATWLRNASIKGDLLGCLVHRSCQLNWR